MRNKYIEEIIIKNLAEDKKFNLYGIGTFYVKPARKGEFKNKHGRGTTNYSWRISFKSSHLLKDKINEFIKK